jgi:methionine sulfoxide reductase heme-binding subunit
VNDPLTHFWWLASRASGVVALLLVTISVGLGLAMAGKVMRKRGLGPKLLAFHEQTALAGLIAIGVHGVTLLGDPWLHASLSGISVPFAMSYRTFYTGLGIIGGWLAALLGLTYYVRRHIGPALWRKAHRATVVVYVLGVIHTLGAGTDAPTSWLRWFLLVTGVPIVALFLRRVLAGRAAAARPRARVTARPRVAVWEESA